MPQGNGRLQPAGSRTPMGSLHPAGGGSARLETASRCGKTPLLTCRTPAGASIQGPSATSRAVASGEGRGGTGKDGVVCVGYAAGCRAAERRGE